VFILGPSEGRQDACEYRRQRDLSGIQKKAPRSGVHNHRGGNDGNDPQGRRDDAQKKETEGLARKGDTEEQSGGTRAEVPQPEDQSRPR